MIDDAGKDLLSDTAICVCGDELAAHNDEGRCQIADCDCFEFREREPEIGEARE